MKAVQLEMFGMSADENHFTSTLWGVLTFFPASSNKWKDTCRHCLLWDNADGHCSEPTVLPGVPTMNALTGARVIFQFIKCQYKETSDKSTTNIATINGISLQVVADEREQLVAVKPVCEILGVNYTTQVEKLKAHPVFGSVIPLRGTTGADGKLYQMLCIPLQFFPGWLFSINPDNVKEEARENLIKYQLECNKVLFDYFFSRVDFSRKKEKAVAKSKEVCDEKLEQLRIAKSELKVAENELGKAMAMTFEEWQADRLQLRIPGFE